MVIQVRAVGRPMEVDYQGIGGCKQENEIFVSLFSEAALKLCPCRTVTGAGALLINKPCRALWGVVMVDRAKLAVGLGGEVSVVGHGS